MKKKCEMRGFPFRNRLTKLVLMMKFAAFFLLFFATQLSASVFSQQTRLKVNFNQATIREVIAEIEKQTDLTFFYSDDVLNLNEVVTLKSESMSIEDILILVSEQTGLSLTVVRDHITVKDPNLFNRTFLQNQQLDISGKVTDSSGAILPGVSIVIKETTTGTITDQNGNFTLPDVPGNATLVFSFVGMKDQEVVVAGQSTFNITMEEDAIGIEEVVAIGYGTMKKSASTVAVSAIDADEISRIPTAHLSNVLAGRLSGTQLTSISGVPGISTNVKVRGTASWNEGNVVYVIDGVVRDKRSFDALDPNEVESISVLKDAAAAAIYGSRATNGVILVTTKMGKKGKLTIDFNTVHGVSRVAKFPAKMGMQEAIDFQQDLFNSIGDDEEEWLLANNPDGRNMYNAVYEDPTTNKYSLNISGGSDDVSYLIAGSYYNEEGFVSSVGYEKYNIRGKINAQLTNNLSIGLNISTSNGIRDRYTATFDNSSTLYLTFGSLLNADPFIRPYIDGKPVHSGWVANLPELLTNSGYWKNTNQQIDALFNVEYKVPKVEGLVLKGAYSKNVNHSYVKAFGQKHTVYTFKKTGTNGLIYTNEVTGSLQSSDPSREYIGNEYDKTDAYQLNAQISYDRTFGDHHVSADAVYEQYDYNSPDFYGYRYNFPLFPKDQFFAASGDSKDWSTGGKEVEDARLAYIFRASYDYAGKYFITASLRRDGSIKFAPDQRWGNFPSVSAAWLLSNEGFYENTKLSETIDFLKVRFSYGSTGNDAIGGWKWIEQYNASNANYYIGTNGSLVPRISYGGIPNPNLTWEKSDSYDIGLDLRMFNSRLDFTIDAWKRHTYDILGERILAIPVGFGGSLPSENYGIVDSKGVDIELGYNGSVGKDFKYEISANFSYNTTEVVRRDVAANTQEIDDPNGKTLDRYIGYKFEKIMRTQADLDALPDGFTHFGAPPALGSAKFADISGPDGTPDGKVDSYDRVELSDHFGAGAAPYAFGITLNLNYKGFYLESLFAGLAGYEKSFSSGWVDGRNVYAGLYRPSPYYRDYWSEDNPNGSMPALYNWGHPQTYSYVQSTSLNVWKVGFLRLRNLNIGYNLPSSWTNKIGLKKASIFVSGTNLFTITSYEMGDPELENEDAYPLMSTYSLGLNISL